MKLSFSMIKKSETLRMRLMLKKSEEEAKRAAAYAAEVTALNHAHVQSLAKIEGLDKELQQAKDHSEHMEFLSQQYADQVNSQSPPPLLAHSDLSFPVPFPRSS